MIVKKYDEVEKSSVIKEGVKNVSIRWLIGKDSNAPTFYLRLFEVEPGGYSPYHTHDWEHEVYVLAGKGELKSGDKSLPLTEGSFALILPGEEHQFVNRGNTTFKFLCIIPKEGQ
jgi:quercetin dioxygenase-like cupin family protein